ncbi:hypothetical protein DY000_02053724 [Brassica cretica]|uniref:Uncharacterized protein n=1 Tax=Brassica cretica TaxID=69181 RepID=A0ABQ7AC21_BRACR|nr:hypothetical protein DY000_02053724 [Brassica cretica]
MESVLVDLKKNVSDIKQYIDNHNNEINENGLDEISAFVWGYNLCRPWWLYRHGLDRALPQDCVDYAAELDANDDLGFLADCGCKIQMRFFDRLSIFTMIKPVHPV